jgi:hypothetical protein
MSKTSAAPAPEPTPEADTSLDGLTFTVAASPDTQASQSGDLSVEVDDDGTRAGTFLIDPEKGTSTWIWP